VGRGGLDGTVRAALIAKGYPPDADVDIVSETTGAQRCKAHSKNPPHKRCMQWAVKGKDVCRMHGGSTPIKHGLYSKYAGSRLRAQIEQAKNDPELLSLREELALSKALISGFLEQLGDDGEFSNIDRQHMLTLIDNVRKVSESLTRIEQGMNMFIDARQFVVLIEQIVSIVRRYADDETAVKIAKHLQRIDSSAGGPGARIQGKTVGN